MYLKLLQYYAQNVTMEQAWQWCKLTIHMTGRKGRVTGSMVRPAVAMFLSQKIVSNSPAYTFICQSELLHIPTLSHSHTLTQSAYTPSPSIPGPSPHSCAILATLSLQPQEDTCDGIMAKLSWTRLRVSFDICHAKKDFHTFLLALQDPKIPVKQRQASCLRKLSFLQYTRVTTPPPQMRNDISPRDAVSDSGKAVVLKHLTTYKYLQDLKLQTLLGRAEETCDGS
ncbi:hypothetical protein SKAU_G00367890 [Synaphobranchus kaupii]|uniref:Uncharacterized protein n=1 Tax=Synaphobranchus kaupii TaxID=118154 RepID=A0A9Q1EFF8_SYNKA|nr:hypothetical protein SKAU_G00367890 [Synaphobranchus kaupii]